MAHVDDPTEAGRVFGFKFRQGGIDEWHENLYVTDA